MCSGRLTWTSAYRSLPLPWLQKLEFSEHRGAMAGESTYELVDPRDLTGKLNLLQLARAQQFGVGDYPVIIRINPRVGLPRPNTGGGDDGVFGSWLHQHPVVLVDCRFVGEGYRHRVYGRFLQAGSVELYGVADRADVEPDPLAFCAESAPVSTVATDVVDTPAVPDSAGGDSVAKASGPGSTSARSATPYSSTEPACKKRPYTQ